MKQTYTIRKFINDLHLWLGIASGLVLFVVCLSGTIYTFHTEIDEWVNSSKYNITLPDNAKPISPDALIEKLEKAQGGVVTFVEINDNHNKPYRFTVVKKQTAEKPPMQSIAGATQPGKTHADAKEKMAKPQGSNTDKGAQKSSPPSRGKTFLINQYTGVNLGTTESSTNEFFMNVMLLHRNLLMENETGKIIVGSATLIFVLMVLSGLVLWFPAKVRTWKRLAAWKPGFRIKYKANWKRVNHDLHNTLGFYSFIVLLIMGLTGLCWSFEWYRDGMSTVLKDQVFKQRSERPLPSASGTAAQRIGVNEIMAVVNKNLNYSGKYRISIPGDSVVSFAVSKTNVGFAAFSGADKLNIDQYSGKLLKVDRFADKPFNQKIAASIRSLHVGEVFSTFSKIVYFICCLIATSLPVTGTIIWINKLKKKRSSKKKTALQPAPAVQL